MTIAHLRSAATIALVAAAFACPRFARADEPMKVGTMNVQRHGDHGSPLILIPGLACGGWVWDDTVAKLKGDHVIYVVTLAGFDGTPPVQGKLMDLASDSLAELIRTQHIEKPVLIGHSLGGTLSTRSPKRIPISSAA
jgi:pimeloyl-ACP methyl ester carboxylesterase